MSWKAAFGIHESDSHHSQYGYTKHMHEADQSHTPNIHARGHAYGTRTSHGHGDPPAAAPHVQLHLQRTVNQHTATKPEPDHYPRTHTADSTWMSGLGGDRMGIALILLSSLFMMQSFAIFVILYKLLSAGL